MVEIKEERKMKREHVLLRAAYQLLKQQPCINSGTEDTANLNLPEYDLLGNYRIFQSRIDVGAFEFQGLDAIYDFSKTNILNIYPNPTKGIIMLEAQGIENVELINIQGKSVYTSKSNVRNIDMEYFAKGIYFVKVITNDGITVRKIIRE